MEEKYARFFKMWDWLVSMGIATEGELWYITGINGYNIDTLIDTLNNVLYYRTGYRTREQYEYSELWDEEEENE